MLYADFVWQCPNCKQFHSEGFANEDDPYTCCGCKRQFILTFSVDVEEIEAYDKKSGQVSEVRLIKMGISHDQGKTWGEIEVDTRDLNPDTSPLKVGDWIKAPGGGSILEIWLNEKIGKLNSRRVYALAGGHRDATE
ncbi:hypothetical protein [Paenibacillus donghaensis]|uniref:Uncharacterized protein n=1 Tax=Paenibacillus donghaensis TaxID=414771 RepID=A0A2Z2KQ28_9BACL|nr:hypothetical protein [Paenibacillus donghaensis]ASA20928.1 hypothetical protein B9T62_09110 [Paenibacillus donghaensis]